MKFESIVKKFLSGAVEGKSGKYVIKGDTLVYQTGVSAYYAAPWNMDSNKAKHFEAIAKLRQAAEQGIILLGNGFSPQDLNKDTHRVEYYKLDSNVIAKRLQSGVYVGNSSILPLVGRRMAWGNEVLNRHETEIQRHLAQRITMIPFNVFDEAKLNLKDMVVVDRGPEETVKQKISKYDHNTGKDITTFETVHFTGASLFKVVDKYFLFDIDRREVEHAIFNPFLVELPRQVGTIEDAYDSLMPKRVKDAIKKGLKVERQGEFFFIPTKITKAELKKRRVFGLDPKLNERLELSAGVRNRPNYATTGFTFRKRAFVTGTVSHSGREHADLKLNGWHEAVPNTAFDKSFTIRGDVD